MKSVVLRSGNLLSSWALLQEGSHVVQANQPPDHYIAEDNFELQMILLPFWEYRLVLSGWVYTMAGIEPRHSCMLGKQ